MESIFLSSAAKEWSSGWAWDPNAVKSRRNALIVNGTLGVTVFFVDMVIALLIFTID
jgi:hypothetical protein